jgi:CRISPR-associated protein Csd1
VKLVSFDKSAFCSHGLEQSLNAAMCHECVEAYTLSLKNLFGKGQSTNYIDGDAEIAYAFWGRDSTDFDLNATFIEADADAVKGLYESLARPSQSESLSEQEASEFYVLALSASGARAVVRDWIETHLPSTQHNIAKWFDDLTIALDRPWPNKSEARAAPPDSFGKFPLKVLCRSVGRKKQIGWEVPVDLSSQLFRAGLTGIALPDSVLAAALRRVRADHDIPPPRAALIKLVLNRLSQSPNKGESKMSETLDSTKPDIAYVCGRLLAVLERIQGRALGNVNASVIDRYYGAASVAPRPIFPRLVANAQNHLGKLRGERPGEATNLQKDMETVVDKIGDREAWIGDLPEWLDLEAQGRFAIGFYHQRADYRARAKKTAPDGSGANSDSTNDTSHELKGEDHAS